MTQLCEISAVAPEDPDGSDEEGHEYLIDLYFRDDDEEEEVEDNETKATMADRFPSLDDFAAGMTPLFNHCPFESPTTPGRNMNAD